MEGGLALGPGVAVEGRRVCYVLVCRIPRYGKSHSINGCQVFQEHHQSPLSPIYHRDHLELRVEFGLH